MGNNNGNNEFQIKLDAKRDARRCLLSALEEFDPAKDKDRIDKVKTTLQQINDEIKDIEKILKDSSVSISPRSDITEASIQKMGDSKNNIKKEMQQLKENIDSERKTWEEKLTNKQKEINNLKAKMNLRQAHLRAEYQLKRRELERIQDELEKKLRKEVQPSGLLEEERGRWQKRLSEKQQIIDDLKIENAQNNAAFYKNMNLLKEETGIKIADLQEETRLLREQKIRDADQYRSRLSQRQMEITELKQKLNLDDLRHKREAEAQKKNHLLELEALNETDEYEKSRIIAENERTRLELRQQISEMEHKVSELHSEIAGAAASQKETEIESRRQLSELTEKSSLRSAESRNTIKHLEINIAELENLLADRSRDTEIERARLQGKIDTQAEHLREASERISQLDGALIRSRKEKDRSEKEKDSRIQLFTDEISQLKEALSAVQRHNEEISVTAGRQLKESEDKFKSNAQAAVRVQNSLKDQILVRESEVEKLKLEIHDILQEKDAEAIKYEEKRKDQDKIYELDLGQKDKVIRSLEEQNAHIISELSVYKTARDHENKAWARQVSEKEIKINELQQDIRKKEKNIDMLNQKSGDLQKEHQNTKELMAAREDDLKQRLADSENRYMMTIEGLNHKIENLQKDNERVVYEKDDAISRLELYLEGVKKAAKTDSEEYGAEKRELLRRLREFDERYESVKKESEKACLDLQEEIGKNETISARMQDAKENLEAERAAAADKITELKKINDRLERQLAQVSGESEHVIEQLKEEKEYQAEKYSRQLLDSEKRIHSHKEKILTLEMSAALENEKHAEEIIKLKDEIQQNLIRYNEDITLKERLLDEVRSDFQSEKEDILSGLDKQKNTNEVLGAQIKTLENRLADREKNNEYLLKELEDTQKNSHMTIADLEKDKYELNEKYNAEKHELLNKLAVSGREMKRLEETLELLKEELSGKTGDYRDKVNSLENSISKSESDNMLRIARKDDEIARLMSLVQALKAEKSRDMEEMENGFRQKEQALTAEKEKLVMDIEKAQTDFRINLSDLEQEKEKEISGLNKTIEELKIILKNTRRQKQNEHERMISEKEESAKVSSGEIDRLEGELDRQKEYYGKIIAELRDDNKVKIWEVNKVRAELENLLKEFEERVAAQRLVWEEKLKNKDEQIKLMREELEGTKSSLEERLEELKDANWRLQVQLEEDRKNWRNEYSDKEKDLRNLKAEKDKDEKSFMKELAQSESEWIKERASLQKNLTQAEAQLESQIQQKDNIISRLQIELDRTNQILNAEKAKYDIEFKDMRGDMTNKMTDLEQFTKKLEEENLKYRTKLSERESELITQKSKLENEISIIENKYDIKIQQLQNELDNLKKDNASLEEGLLKKSKALGDEKREKEDEIDEVRRRLDRNLEEFKMKLNIDIQEHTDSSRPASEDKGPMREDEAPVEKKEQSGQSAADLKKQLKEFRKEKMASIRIKEDAYLSASSQEEKERLKKEIESIEKERRDEESLIYDRIKEIKRQGK